MSFAASLRDCSSDAYAEAAPGSRPALILFVQTFGDLANFNEHVHVLATDGAGGGRECELHPD